MNRSLNVRGIAILYFLVATACGEPAVDLYQRNAELLGLDLQEETVWRFSVDDGSEEAWTLTPSLHDDRWQVLLTRSATIGGIPLPNPREDLLGIEALGLAWLRQGDCAVQVPACRQLGAAPILLRLPFPTEMAPHSADVELQPPASSGSHLRTRGEQIGSQFQLVYTWDWDEGGETVWAFEAHHGLREFTDVIAGGSPRSGSRL